MILQPVRDEIRDVLDDQVDAQIYNYLPGSAQLPGIVVGLPSRIDPTVTTGFWELEIPVYVVTRSADPLAGETTLLDLVVEVVEILKSTRSGTTFSTLRISDVSDLFQITVGTVEAHSAQINLSVLTKSPV